MNLIYFRTCRNHMLWLSAFICIVAAGPSSLADKSGVFIAEIRLDSEQPQELGLKLDPSLNPKFVQLNLKGHESGGWMSETTADRRKGWERAMRFKIDDSRFFDGQCPAVDIELEYHLPSWGGVRVCIDTADGVKNVGNAWGNTGNWKTARFRVDNARFQRDVKDAVLGEFDILISGANGPLHIRRLKIAGYETKKNIHWPRMLKIDRLETGKEGDVLVFQQKPSDFKAYVANVAWIDVPVSYKFSIFDWNGRTVHHAEGEILLSDRDSTPVNLSFESQEWLLGPYEGLLNLTVHGTNAPTLERRMRMGIVSDTELQKARTGEFMYGLDQANQSIYAGDTATAFAYYRLMGVDLLRALPMRGGLEIEKVDSAMEHLRREKLRASLFVDPPRPRTAQEPLNYKALKKQAGMLATIIRKYAGRGQGQIPFVELGNEPDLPGFWPGSIDQYVESMNLLADVLQLTKRAVGLEKDDLTIMNGGLSFAGTTGDLRSCEFLRKADFSKLDAIAYHGHGPGIKAERTCFERLQSALAETGKPAMTAVETESGFSANSNAGLMIQARTVVEKMTYAQSVGSPAFMFFRLFMEGVGTNEGGYGMTESFVEPRPSVLSYRAMVERLRHHRYVTSLDAEAVCGFQNVNVFLFEEIDDDRSPAGRKTLVAFSEVPATYELGVVTGEAEDIMSHDLFGNRKSVATVESTMVVLTVGIDPVYLTWTNNMPAEDVDLLPPLLDVAVIDSPLPGHEGQLHVIARNPTSESVDATIKLNAAGALPLEIKPSEFCVTIPARGQEKITAVLHVGDYDKPLRLPRYWTVFPDADPAQLPEVLMTGTVPLELKCKDGSTSTGQQVWTPDGKILMLPLAGGIPKNHRPSIGFAYIYSPGDMILQAAASADWWMTWYVNDKQVYTTEPLGNNHGSMADHRFDLPLRAGRNLLVFHCGSGTHGWEIQFGGPQQRALAIPGGKPLENISAALTVNQSQCASILQPVIIEQPIARLDNIPDDFAMWQYVEPLTVLGADAVENLFIKEPDSSRWYKGHKDLSAKFWLVETQGMEVAAFVEVVDDLHYPGDGVRLLFRDDLGQLIVEGRPEGLRDMANGITRYLYKIDQGLLDNKPFRIFLEIEDDDGFGLKQVLKMGNLGEPKKCMRQALTKFL